MDKNKSFANDFIAEMRQTDLDDRLPENECLVPYAGAKQALIKLLFIKAMMSPGIIETIDQNDLVTLWNFTRMVACAGGGYKEDVLEKALTTIKKNYNLQKNILEIDLLQNIMQNHWFILNQNFADGSSDDFSSDEYASSIADLISRPQSSRDSANTYQYYTNESLQHLAARILNVKNTETFMDCCCGMFSSALYNDAANYIGVEQDKEMAGIAAMILIMAKKKFNIKLENFVESNDENVADKILADIPCGAGMPQMENRPYSKNTEAYCIENVVKALKDGGTAVVACLGSILGKQDSSKKLREAITRNHLKAVIALPPMSNGTKSNTNLIVLQKNCHAEEIKFINASNLEIKNKNRLTLDEADISDIIGCLNGEETKSLFKDIPVEEILNSDSISWTPNNYVKGEEKSKGRAVEEIDKDLKESYKELKELFLD